MMKRLAGVVLGLSSGIALQTAVSAQVSPATLKSIENNSEVQSRSEFLTIESVSVDDSSQAVTVPGSAQIYGAERLKAVSESLKAKPDSGGFLDSIPTDLIHTPSFPSAENSAIDFFQVPPPDPSVGININTR
jgi:hypothetical protein